MPAKQTRPRLRGSVCHPAMRPTPLIWNFASRERLWLPEPLVEKHIAGSLADQPEAPGESQLRVLPNERALPKEAAGAPLPESKSELPPVIRRAEVVAFALVTLLIISVVAVLYVAKAFFLPIVTAFVVGTMLSPAAGYLERHRVPRVLSAVLIVAAVSTALTFMVGLISSPLIKWSTRLPELGSLLKDKLHVFDRPLALW